MNEKSISMKKRIAALEKAIDKLYELDLPLAFRKAKADNRKLEKRVAHLEEFLLVKDFDRKIAGKQ